MSVAVIYRCTICEEMKKATNHWFVAVQVGQSLTFHKWDDARDMGILQESSTLHLCGEKHAQELLSRFLNPKPKGEPYDASSRK